MPSKQSTSKQGQADAEKYTLHVIAAAAGELLSGLAVVATSQFPDIQIEVVTHPLQSSLEKLEATLDKISGQRQIVLHALADDKAKLLVRNKCVVRRIPHFDATGPLLDFMSDCVGRLPQNDITRLHRLDSAYQRRIEAMEFALAHDDSLGLRTLREADIVIVGISRVSKSPTTLYLSSRGHKVANISISPEASFPPELARISKKKIVAFTVQPKRLHEIRTERGRSMGMEDTAYMDLQSIIREVMAAEDEYKRRGYPTLDVTNLTIEQTAARVLQLLNMQQP